MRHGEDTIVIIDSGVDKSHPCFTNQHIEGISIRYDNGEILFSDEYNDTLGHGTAICGIISKNVPSCKIFMIKIFFDELYADTTILSHTLQYIYNNIPCSIINMSIGHVIDTPELRQVCKLLYEKCILLISAFDNDGAVSFPAAYECVIGVDQSHICNTINDFIYIENSLINVLAKGGTSRVAWLDKKYMLMQGSSFSAAYLSAYFLQRMKEIDGMHSALELLKQNAKNIYGNKYRSEDLLPLPFHIDNAAVIPYNKEVHSLINFYDILPFKIKSIHTISYFGKSHNMVHSHIGNKEFMLQSFDEILWSEIDTLIIGHLQEFENYSKKSIKEMLIKQCLKNRINIYSFDRELIEQFEQEFEDNGLHIYYPKEINPTPKKMGKLYTLRTPVLGIFGTSSAQGKFTLQLFLRKAFIEHGFSVGQLGTEPSSLLFDMDAVFPMGYASTVELQGDELIERVNEIMYNIDLKNDDIIIVGGQSGTIPRYNFNILHLHSQQINFLLGCNPDYVILVVNLFDDLDYIRRTKNAIEDLTECTVFAIAISPLIFIGEWNLFNNKKKLASNEEINFFKKQLMDEFSIPSYIIDENEIPYLFEKIIKVFTRDI